jgi:hypothetical protein
MRAVMEQLPRRRQVRDTSRPRAAVRTSCIRFETRPGAGAGQVAHDTRIDDDEDAAGGHRPLVCAACGQRITDDAHRVERGGAHEHTFVNPGGFVHHVACFAVATGCSYQGDPETAFTWFPGFAWQIAACSACYTLLGWRFHAKDDSFHGLIVGAIRHADD